MSKMEKNYCCELVASVTGETVRIFGYSLEESCRVYERIIKRMVSDEQKAIEQGRYALFILEQIEQFPFVERIVRLRYAGLLLNNAIGILEASEKNIRTRYSRQIELFRKNYLIADKLLQQYRAL